MLLAPSLAHASNCGNGTSVASAGSCALTDLAGSYDPQINDNKAGAAIADGGNTVTLTGNGSDVARGDNGYQAYRLGDLDPSAEGQERLLLGSKNNGISVPDPVTGGNAVISTYNTGSITTSNWGDVSNSSTGTIDNVNGEQYIDARLGTATGTGSKLVVDIGDGGIPDASQNSITMAAKQTTLTEANSGGAVEWTSRNELWSNSARVAAAGSTAKTYEISVPTYAGTFTGFDGASHTVTNAAELQAYNDALKSALENGSVDLAVLGYGSPQAAYDGEFGKAVSFTTEEKSWTVTINPGDEVTLPRGDNYALVATGKGSIGTIVAGGQIDQRGFAVVATDGGHIQIEAGGSLSGDDTSLYVQNAATAVNNGVISGGYFAQDGYDTAAGPGNYRNSYIEGQTVNVIGTGSRFDNNGIINVAGYTYDEEGSNQYAVRVESAATASNAGIINLGVNNNPLSGTLTGADVRGSSSFTNEESGLIYIGRAAQYDVANPEAVADTANALPAYGMTIRNSATAINEGAIVIGSLTENAAAMYAHSNSTGTLINRGEITINGAANAAPLQNVGILVADSNASASIRNEGTININGVNGVGVKVLSTGSAAPTVTTTADSIINIAGGADPASGTRNFGVWVEGESSGIASASIDGQINLTGVGGIGVHARGKAEVDVTAGAVPNFLSGSDQIGFFIYGQDATINVDATAMDVSTERSTLFRIAEGADLTAAGLTVTTSGKDSVGILGTGAGTEINADDGVFNVSGDGATAIIVEGGATGTMNGTSVTLTGANSVGGVADGQKHDLSGGTVGSPDATTILIANAQLSSSAQGATGFIASNDGTVKISGQTTLNGEGSIGALAQDNGNVELIDATFDVSGWATKAQRGTNTFTVTNSTLTGSDGVLNIVEGATATFTANNSTLNGDIITDAASSGDVFLNNNTVLTGRIDTVSMKVDETSTWNVTGSSILQNLTNAGAIHFLPPTGDPSSMASYKTITTNGDYTGADGLITFNTALGNDSSPTDRLIIQGDSLGSTSVRVVNTGGTGAPTVEGIKIVDVAGLSSGTFSLIGDYEFQGDQAVIAGAYAYRLYKNGVSTPTDGDWYLRSSITDPNPEPQPEPQPEPEPQPQPAYQPGTPVYEAYGQNLMALNGLPTLQQRVGNRQWAQGQNQSFINSGNGIWGRVDGTFARPTAAHTTSRTNVDTDSWRIQLGIDRAFYQQDDGEALIAGLNGYYGEATSDVSSLFGDGEIKTDGYGVGATLTWYEPRGFYVDAQAQFSWFSTELQSDILGTLAEDNDGKGHAFSLEIGRRTQIRENLTLTPQVQTVYSHVSFKRFVDPFEAQISLNDGNSLKTRLGLSLDRQNTWNGTADEKRSSHVYGIANLIYEWLDGTNSVVSGANLRHQNERLWGEIGVGGSYSWNDQVTLYLEASGNTALKDFGESYSLKANAGIRIKW